MAERLIGLDIGTSLIRAVEVTSSDGQNPILEAYGQVGLPFGAVINGEIHEVAVVAEALRRLWHEGGFKEKKVHLGVAGLRAITREMDMPPVSLDELDNAVLYEAEQVLPFPIEQTCVSAKVIAQFQNAEGQPEIRVLVAAVHREVIDPIIAAVEEAGLEPVGMDLNTAALARAMADPQFQSGPDVVVSVGASLTLVVVHQAGLLQFVRTIDLGGQSITEAIASTLGLPFLDAERIKRTLGPMGTGDHQVDLAITNAISELVGEIQNSIRFYSSLPGRFPPSRLVVTGTGTRTMGFLNQLQASSELAVIPVSPLSLVQSRLKVSPTEAAAIDAGLAVPIGLALKRTAEKDFNLLPKEITAAHAADRLKRTLRFVAIAVVGLILIASVGAYLRVKSATSTVKTQTASLKTIKTVDIPKFDTVTQLEAKVKSLQTRFVELLAHENDWLTVLNQMGSCTPPGYSAFQTINLTANPIIAAPTSSTKKSTTTTVAATIGNATGSAEIHTAGIGYRTFNNDMTHCAGITFQITPLITNTIPFTAQVDFGITPGSGSQRVTTFNKPIP